MVIRIVMSVLVLVTLLVVTAMAVGGLIGVLGSMRLVRCPSCHHLARTVPPSAHACPHCYYERALHALHLGRGRDQHIAAS